MTNPKQIIKKLSYKIPLFNIIKKYFLKKELEYELRDTNLQYKITSDLVQILIEEGTFIRFYLDGVRIYSMFVEEFLNQRYKFYSWKNANLQKII